MYDNRVSRFPYGANNQRESGILSDLPFNSRITKTHEWIQDFDRYAATEWVVTGAGSAALTSGDGGLLAVTSPVSAFQSLQDTPASFTMNKGFRAWMSYRASLDSLLGNIIVGLLNLTTTPFTGASQTDGIYITSAVTTGALTANIAVGGTITSVAMGVSIVAASQFILDFYYDGANYAAGYPNGRVVFEASGPGASANVRSEILIPAASTFPGATVLAPTLGVSASTAVARVLTVDALWFAKDRQNINATPAF